ncbi:MAG: hypothetical protein H6587_07465 [Flavobacteriales bacterium]|nr:hypothetical protein [Flavobacteriales bacterium]MCB9364389.1 hypothetical protein [Flavobacteriales bacterium]
MKSVIPLSIDLDNSILLSYYNFKKAFNQKHSIDISNDYNSFKKGLDSFLQTSPNFNSNLLIKNGEVVGTFNTLLLNKDLPEEILDTIVSFIDDDSFLYFIPEVTTLINRWKFSAKKIKTNVVNKELKNSFKKEGFREANISIYFHLKRNNINNKLIRHLIEENIPQQQNLDVELNKELKGNEINEVAHLMTTLLNDILRFDNHEVFNQTPERIQRVVEQHKRSNNNSFHLLLRNKENELIGISIIVFKKENPTSVNQFMTGVLKEYRGLGLPTWMKAYMYDYLQKNYPTIELIKTDCFSGNTPMIHINKKMGFEEAYRTTEMVYENN